MPVDRDAARVDLNLAARSGDIDVVRSQLRRPCTDLETRDILGDTGLLKASRYGHAEVRSSVRLLVDPWFGMGVSSVFMRRRRGADVRQPPLSQKRFGLGEGFVA